MVGANEATTRIGRNPREKYLDRSLVAAHAAGGRALTARCKAHARGDKGR